MKQRDIETLSSYLDGQLSSADAARLEGRLRTDPEMRSVLQDLRGARSLLRQLPVFAPLPTFALEAVARSAEEIAEMTLAFHERPYRPADLFSARIDNPDDLFIAVEEPLGIVEVTVERDT